MSNELFIDTREPDRERFNAIAKQMIRVADRLGVKPMSPGDESYVTITTNEENGRISYSLFDIIEAHLNFVAGHQGDAA